MKIKIFSPLFISILAVYLLFPPESSSIEIEDEKPLITYAKEQIVQNSSIIEIEIDTKIKLLISGLQRFLVVDGDKIDATKPIVDEIVLTAKELGQTFIHIWDKDGRASFRVIVKARGFGRLKEIKERQRKRKMAEPFTVDYSLDFTHMESESEYTFNEFKYVNYLHNTSLTGETPYGYLSSKFRYEQRETTTSVEKKEVSDLTELYLQFAADDFTLEAGDIFETFSQLSFSNAHLQGISTRASLQDVVDYKFVWGSGGYLQWGGEIKDFGELKNRVYGIKTSISPVDYLNIFSVLAHADETKGKTARDIMTFGTDYKMNKFLSFKGEFANNDDSQSAWYANAKLNLKKAALSATYRSIDPDYLSVFRSISYRGQKGFYLTGKARPTKNTGLSSRFNYYRHELSPNPEDMDKYNSDFSISGKVSLGKGSSLRANYWRNDNEGKEFPTTESGYKCEFRQKLSDVPILKKGMATFTYEDKTYKNISSAESNYDNQSLIAALSVRPLKKWSFGISEAWNRRDFFNNNESTSPRRFRAYASYGSRIGKLPLKSRFRVEYQKDNNINQDVFSAFTGEDSITGEAKLTWDVTRDSKVFIGGEIKDVEGSVDPTKERREHEIRMGGDVSWETMFRWEGTGLLDGYVFKDENLNGRREMSEEPLKGITVYLAEDKNVETDENGYFSFGKVKRGEVVVSLDTKDLPQGYEPTRSSRYRVPIRRNRSNTVNFGAMTRTRIKGVVMNDLNRNDRIDEEDKGIPNVLVLSEAGQAAFTDSFGHFRFDIVEPGEHILTVKAETLPKEIVLKPPFTRKLVVEESSIEAVEFYGYALRSIKGKVYFDKNKNKRFDKEDSPVEDAMVRCGKKVAITDKNGDYLLKDLPAGEVILSLKEDSVPEEYHLITEKDKKITLPEQTILLEKMDFILEE